MEVALIPLVVLLVVTQVPPRVYTISEYTSDVAPHWVTTIVEVEGRTVRRIEMTSGDRVCAPGRVIVRAAEAEIDPARNPFADICTRTLADHAAPGKKPFGSYKQSLTARCPDGDRRWSLDGITTQSLPAEWLRVLEDVAMLESPFGEAWAFRPGLTAGQDLALRKAAVPLIERLRSGAYASIPRLDERYSGPGAVVVPRVVVEGHDKLRLTHFELPAYPESAVSRWQQDSVGLRIGLDGSGTVVRIETKWGPFAMVQSTIAAARRWRFAAGTPTPVDIRVVYSLACQS